MRGSIGTIGQVRGKTYHKLFETIWICSCSSKKYSFCGPVYYEIQKRSVGSKLWWHWFIRKCCTWKWMKLIICDHFMNFISISVFQVSESPERKIHLVPRTTNPSFNIKITHWIFTNTRCSCFIQRQRKSNMRRLVFRTCCWWSRCPFFINFNVGSLNQSR